MKESFFLSSCPRVFNVISWINMGLIFDIHTAKLYNSWYKSSKGKTMDRFFEELIPVLVSPRKGERLLDIGCGSGNHLLQLNKKGLDVSGIDASPYMISLARQRLGNRCSLKTGMAEDLPYEDNEFDYSILINTFEFLDDPLQVLREAGRVTKNKILIVVMNSVSWDYFSNRFQGLFRKAISNHTRCYSLWELRSYVNAAFGHAPVKWESTRTLSSPRNKPIKSHGVITKLQRIPIGAFIGLAVTLKYTVKTDNLPLTIHVRSSKKSIVQALPIRRI